MSYYNQQQPPVGVPPPQGYPPEGYPKDAYPPPGYPQQGYPPPQGYPQGYPPPYAPQYAQPPPQQQNNTSGLMEGWYVISFPFLSSFLLSVFRFVKLVNLSFESCVLTQIWLGLLESDTASTRSLVCCPFVKHILQLFSERGNWSDGPEIMTQIVALVPELGIH